jgi:hypothetical protein
MDPIVIPTIYVVYTLAALSAGVGAWWDPLGIFTGGGEVEIPREQQHKAHTSRGLLRTGVAWDVIPSQAQANQAPDNGPLLENPSDPEISRQPMEPPGCNLSREDIAQLKREMGAAAQIPGFTVGMLAAGTVGTLTKNPTAIISAGVGGYTAGAAAGSYFAWRSFMARHNCGPFSPSIMQQY